MTLIKEHGRTPRNGPKRSKRPAGRILQPFGLNGHYCGWTNSTFRAMLNETSAMAAYTIVKLQFQTPQQLAAFRKAIDKPVKTDIVNLVLVCPCTDVELCLAVNNFGASVIS